MAPATQAVGAIYSGDALCDNASPSLCVNLRFGGCGPGTVVQGYRLESTDDNEGITRIVLSTGRIEFAFDACGDLYCIAHASNHALYLSLCSSSGPDTWVLESGPHNSALYSPGGGAYMWASSTQGAQMALSVTIYSQTEWFDKLF
jgi:hypothetical protein